MDTEVPALRHGRPRGRQRVPATGGADHDMKELGAKDEFHDETAMRWPTSSRGRRALRFCQHLDAGSPRPTPPRRSASTCALAVSRPSSREEEPRRSPETHARLSQRVDHPPWMPTRTSSATSSSDPSHWRSNGAPRSPLRRARHHLPRRLPPLSLHHLDRVCAMTQLRLCTLGRVQGRPDRSTVHACSWRDAGQAVLAVAKRGPARHRASRPRVRGLAWPPHAVLMPWREVACETLAQSYAHGSRMKAHHLATPIGNRYQ